MSRHYGFLSLGSDSTYGCDGDSDFGLIGDTVVSNYALCVVVSVISLRVC